MKQNKKKEVRSGCRRGWPGNGKSVKSGLVRVVRNAAVEYYCIINYTIILVCVMTSAMHNGKTNGCTL